MRKYEWRGDNGEVYIRISKTAAKKAYDEGETVWFCPCNLRPGWPWYSEYPATKKDMGMEFEKLLNNFEAHNCINSETGKYAAFYIIQKEV